MAIDPVGGTLGAIAILFPLYDSCKRLFEGCKEMRTFGRDFVLLWRGLEGQLAILKLCMGIDRRDLEHSPDPDDRNHEVTRSILGQLEILETYFRKSEDLVQGILKKYIASKSALSDQGSLPSLVDTLSISPSSDRGTPTKKSQMPSKSIFRKLRKSKDAISIEMQSTSSHSVEQSHLPEISASLTVPTGHSISSKDTISRHLGSVAGVWNRMIWVDHARANFESYLREIQTANRTLKQILKHRSPQQTSELILRGREPETQSNSDDRRALALLHHALSAINNDRNSSQALSLSISDQFLENKTSLQEIIDEKSLWAQLEFLSPSLGSTSVVFWLLKRMPENDSHSTFVMVESRPAEAGKLPTRSIRNISELGLGLDEPADGQYVAVGAIESPVSASRHHAVFRERSKWIRSNVLKDILSDPSLAARLDIRTVAVLARNILTAFLNLTDVWPQMQSLNLKSFEYFRSPMQPDSEATELSTPYLTCGFGQRPPVRRPGMKAGPRKDPNHNVLELGLLLYQLGSRTVLDVQSENLEMSRQTALRSIQDVDECIGTAFATIVDALLRSNHSSEQDVVRAGIGELERFIALLDAHGSRVTQEMPDPALTEPSSTNVAAS